MATIVARKRADGPRFTAVVRLNRDGKLVHRESKTFSTRAAAKEWGKRRGVELQDTKSLVIATTGAMTLAVLIQWYIDTFHAISGWQRSKQKIPGVPRKTPNRAG